MDSTFFLDESLLLDQSKQAFTLQGLWASFLLIFYLIAKN